ncbi:4Fe-4S dicluster domain-containing protein [Magnetococcales bacterium HHB-1]
MNDRQTSNLEKIVIYYDEERFEVSAGRTVLAALEEVGYRFIRGIGCRGGVCGACAALFRIRGGDAELHAMLLCQEMVQEGMEILPLPAFPQRKVNYRLEKSAREDAAYRVINTYPEVTRCIMCGECSRLCPVQIQVMEYVGMIKRGDLRAAAKESFTCVQCQLCALRCPAQISQPNAALMARRFYGRFLVSEAEHLTSMLEKMKQPQMDAGMRQLRHLSKDELRVLYQRREREPDDAPPGTWLPEDRSLLLDSR